MPHLPTAQHRASGKNALTLSIRRNFRKKSRLPGDGSITRELDRSLTVGRRFQATSSFPARRSFPSSVHGRCSRDPPSHDLRRDPHCISFDQPRPGATSHSVEGPTCKHELPRDESRIGSSSDTSCRSLGLEPPKSYEFAARGRNRYPLTIAERTTAC